VFVSYTPASSIVLCFWGAAFSKALLLANVSFLSHISK